MVDVLTQIQQDKVNIRDQLGSRPAVTPYLVYEFTESVEVDELPIVVEVIDTTADSIYRRSDAIYRVSRYQRTHTEANVVKQVVLPNNTFKDYLRDNTFVDTSNTTAVVSYTDNSITF